MSAGWKVFFDYHHMGAAKAIVLLFGKRLGCELYMPSQEFAQSVADRWDKTWVVPPSPVWLKLLGIDYKVTQLSLEEFEQLKFHLILVTRTEMQTVMEALGRKEPMIALMGNEGAEFDWSKVKGFMSSDYLSYVRCPLKKKIHYCQEVWLPKHVNEFPGMPQKACVSTFVNNWPLYDEEWQWDFDRSHHWGTCPHCLSIHGGLDHTLPVNWHKVWCEAKEKLNHIEFCEYGMGNRLGHISEALLPLIYQSSILTVHLKRMEGYGFSMLQSIFCGTPVVVPKKFYQYRTARRFLIPNLTCFEIDWCSDALVEVIEYMDGPHTCSVHKGACLSAGRAIMDNTWEVDAMRVEKFLDDVWGTVL